MFTRRCILKQIRSLALPPGVKPDSVNIKFVHPTDTTEPAINTMDRILSILKDAETSSLQLELRRPEPEQFDVKFYTSLGSDVFDYKVIRILNELEIVNKYSEFETLSPISTIDAYRQYLAILKDAYSTGIDSSTDSMEKIGRVYGENPASTAVLLDNQIRGLCLKILVDSARLRKNDRFTFDFSEIWFYMPFREQMNDPLALQKGLSMKAHPLNLLAVMMDDQNVLRKFFEGRSNIPLEKIRNFLAVQGLEGSLAFKMVVKRYLRTMDPERTIHSPFEGYHRAASDPETESDIQMVKAIVAGRTKLMTRMIPFRDYQRALQELPQSHKDSDEMVIRILANMFDRFFGVCFRADAKYCIQWVETLIEFYLKNQQNEPLFESFFDECIDHFRQSYLELMLKVQQRKWTMSKDDSNERKPKKKNQTHTKKSKRQTEIQKRKPKNQNQITELVKMVHDLKSEVTTKESRVKC